MKKNVASQRIYVFAFNYSTGAPVTGDAANITMQISKDNGAFNAITDTNPTEVAHGRYYFDVTQAESNADIIHCDPVSSTANVVVLVEGGNTIVTVPSYFADLGIESDGDLTQVNNCVANTDMRGTDNAALASAWTATRAGYIDLLNTYLDAAISSRLASAGYTAPDNTNIGNIHTIVSSVVHGNAALKTLIDSIVVDTGTDIPALINTLNDLSQADIRTAVGLAAANLDTQLAAIASYIDTEVTAIINAIAALNDISEAQVNAACDTAISDAALSTAANLAIVKLVVDAIKVITDQLTFTGTYVNSQVKAKDNIDFGALEKASINAQCDTAIADAGIPAATITALWAKVVDGTKTFGKLLKSLNATIRGKSTRTLVGTTVTQTFMKEDGTTPQLTGTIEDDGTRTTTVEAD